MKLKHNITCLILLLNLPSITSSQCIIEGPRNASTYTNNTSIGTVTWTNPGNAIISDDNRATAGALVGILSTVTTNYLVATNFGFNIPLTAIVCGIEIDIEKRANGLVIGSSINDNQVRIVKNGIITGTNHQLGNNFTTTDNYLTHGNNADAWGTTWTPAEINSSNFGIAYSANLNAGLAAVFLSAEIDHIQISVYYDIPLPIKLNYFNAKRTNQTIKLTWETSSEINNDYFSIERSVDGLNWETREKINGAGNSNRNLPYSFEDENNFNKNSYYRLKQTDFNGNYEYSNVISVEPNYNTNISIYPNPSFGNINIESEKNITKVEVLTLLGKKVFSKSINSKKAKIDLTQLTQDIYLIKTYTINNVSTNRIVLRTN